MNWIFNAFANVYGTAMMGTRPASRNAAIANDAARLERARIASSLAGAR